jgi:hypothetical protein
MLHLDLEQLALLGLLSSTIHWLIARSGIAKPLWSRARGFLASLLACAACSGFWIGGALVASGLVRPVQGDSPWISLIASGFLSTLLTPVFEGVLLWGLQASAIEQPDDPSDLTETSTAKIFSRFENQEKKNDN